MPPGDAEDILRDYLLNPLSDRNRNNLQKALDEVRELRRSLEAAREREKSIAVRPQPAPTGEGIDVTTEVIKMLEERKKLGTLKYGRPLHTNNGRDPLVDALQEAIDLVVYLAQAVLERGETRDFASK